jgi:hypothetical protein
MKDDAKIVFSIVSPRRVDISVEEERGPGEEEGNHFKRHLADAAELLGAAKELCGYRRSGEPDTRAGAVLERWAESEAEAPQKAAERESETER